MSELTVVKYPHAVLRKPCPEVANIDGKIVGLAQNMLSTMIAAKGIGLAAPQVGESLRLFVADVSEDRSKPLMLANPKIIQKQDDITMEEGCLSLPGVAAPVRRARCVAVSGIDMNGNETTIEAEELLAVCIQHEIDHLDGVLFFDHLSHLKRTRLLHKYKKLNT